MMSPETAVGPTQQAPPDRPTITIEQWAQQGLALLFGDNVLDMNERKIVYALFQEISMRAQQGGIGQGGTPPAEQDPNSPPPQSPQDMNQNTEDYGTAEGATPEEEGGY